MKTLSLPYFSGPASCYQNVTQAPRNIYFGMDAPNNLPNQALPVPAILPEGDPLQAQAPAQQALPPLPAVRRQRLNAVFGPPPGLAAFLQNLNQPMQQRLQRNSSAASDTTQFTMEED